MAGSSSRDVLLFGGDEERFRLAMSSCESAEADVSERSEALSLFDAEIATRAVIDYLPIQRTPAPLAPGAEASPLSGRMAAYEGLVATAARNHGLDPLFLHAIIDVESGHRPNAVSPAGAIGLMQVMPDTARRFGVADPHTELFDVQRNLEAGAAYLAFLKQRFAERTDLILAAYNAGEQAVQRYGGRIPPYAETRSYVKAVTARYNRLRASSAR
jgi:soluble lytic murein transglycosylase-like protein